MGSKLYRRVFVMRTNESKKTAIDLHINAVGWIVAVYLFESLTNNIGASETLIRLRAWPSRLVWVFAGYSYHKIDLSNNVRKRTFRNAHPRKTQISLRIRVDRSESSLSAWRICIVSYLTCIQWRIVDLNLRLAHMSKGTFYFVMLWLNYNSNGKQFWSIRQDVSSVSILFFLL